MSHVDEGELTAYADGAYASDDADAQRIGAHLAVCANCRNRLAQAQMLTARAGEILAVATPMILAPPSFEQLQDRAVTGASNRKRVPMAWAASVILAIGLGWFGRGAVVREPAMGERANGQMAERAIGQVGERANDYAADQTPTVAAAPPSVVLTPQAAASGAAGMAAKTNDVVAGPPTELPQTAAEVAHADAPSPTPPLAAARVAAPPPSTAAQNAFATGRATADAGVALSRDRDVEYLTAAEAERRGIALHIVPELEVLRVGLKDGETLVEQKLPDGKILTVASSVEPIAISEMEVRKEKALSQRESKAVAAPVPVLPGVVVIRGAARIRVFANVPADSLRSLAAKIR